ncbi:hypothetical protein [Pseudanabaena sp. PCC 6802]|uniref:hypothetical protein n=1 Tax=Pseudanabaena sp. PCC 6802 TaxID=118173 RepID=UPI00034A3D4C|nr:hypothetical protein [Pseudanabaena sp. PCC 6802]
MKEYDSCFSIALLMSAVIIFAGTAQIYFEQTTTTTSTELHGVATRLLALGSDR